MITKMCQFVSIIVLAVVTIACAATPTPTPEVAMGGTEGMEGMGTSLSTNDYAPLVLAYYEGEEMFFIHTEASDEGVATMLTEMMNGPLVVLVLELAEAPAALLADVFVFTNGLEGHGPFGFQPDIFDSVPGDPNYRPLRDVNLVEWKEGADVRELKTLADLKAAEERGEVTITRPGIVVNMPVLVWKGGSR